MSSATNVAMAAERPFTANAAAAIEQASASATAAAESCEHMPLLFYPRPMDSCAREVRERLSHLSEPVSGLQVVNAVTQQYNSLSTVAALIAGLSFGALLFQGPAALQESSSARLYLVIALRVFFFSSIVSLLCSVAALVTALSAQWLSSLGLMAHAGLSTAQFLLSLPRKRAKYAATAAGALMTMAMVSFLIGVPGLVLLLSHHDQALSMSETHSMICFAFTVLGAFLVAILAVFLCVRDIIFTRLTMGETK